jgi:hypothetical protein
MAIWNAVLLDGNFLAPSFLYVGTVNIHNIDTKILTEVKVPSNRVRNFLQQNAEVGRLEEVVVLAAGSVLAQIQAGA